MDAGPSLEAGKVGGENHLLESTLSKVGTSYTGGGERKMHKSGRTCFVSFLLSIWYLSPALILPSTSSLFSSFLPSYLLQDSADTGKAKMLGILAGNPEEHLNPPGDIYLC